MAAADGGHRPRLRVLCLHGRCQNAATFERKLEKLTSKAASFAEFCFVDGPVELPLQHGERINTRGWWKEEDGSEDDSQVLEALTEAWASQGPFDGVLGFSEGCRAAVVFCQMAALAVSPSAEGAVGAGAGLRFAVLAGAPDVPQRFKAAGTKIRLPSLHFASASDTVVPLSDSKALAENLFSGAQFLEHDGGHTAPQRVEDVRRVASFFEEQRDAIYPAGAKGAWGTIPVCGEDGEDPRVNTEQREELEALAAVYPEELVRCAPAWPVRLTMSLTSARDATALHFTFPPAYPQNAQCLFELHTEDLGVMAHIREIQEAAEAERGPQGLPSVMGMAQAAQDWIQDHQAEIEARASGGAGAGGAEACEAAAADDSADAWWLKEDDEVDEALLQEAQARAAELMADDSGTCLARACGAGGYGRPWEFVVGLVGKPSAGKSTLFNAATRPEQAAREAAMAPHPFTTIDPNVGTGWFAAPCPVEKLGLVGKAVPEYGAVQGGRRRMPLLVKDVAGLVPGAYLGRGKGNAFLNDLCDADSLVHVVDASGRSDREGVDQGAAATGDKAAGDPLDEVGWVRREIHLWIFCNVRAKWDSIRRKARMAVSHTMREHLAERLFSLFTGYHASRQLVTQVYEAAGFSLPGMAEAIMSWTEYQLHLLVACFLRARFPIVVALNKVDTQEAQDNVARARAALGAACRPVSARSEWWLWDQQRKGHLTQDLATGDIALVPGAPAELQPKLEQIQREVIQQYGSTGVLEVLSLAVSMRRPLYACPVSDLSTFDPLQASACASPAVPSNGTSGAYAGGRAAPLASAAPAAPLATMVLLRPLSTVEEAFSALKHEGMLRGDFVRAEMLTDLATRAARVLKRDETLHGGDADQRQALVLKVLTNKKAK